jgi:hypothetical protein
MDRPALLLLIALAGCSSATAPSPGEVWGGEGLGLTMAAGGGTLEYDCADGRIDGPIVPDGSGRFQATGTHTPGRGGPVHEDDPPPAALPARYEGRVDGDRMELLVLLPAAADTVGRFELRRGRTPTIRRCL